MTVTGKHPYNQICDCTRCLNEAKRRSAQSAAHPHPTRPKRRQLRPTRDIYARWKHLDDIGYFDHSDGEVDW